MISQYQTVEIHLATSSCVKFIMYVFLLQHLPSPGEANFLPPSYEDICNGVDSQNQLSISSMSLNIEDELPEYAASMPGQRGSMTLSTFYNDGQSVRMSASISCKSDVESDSESDVQYQRQTTQVSKGGQDGVFVA